jgi:outer membrane biosynthesis protein TonB
MVHGCFIKKAKFASMQKKNRVVKLIPLLGTLLLHALLLLILAVNLRHIKDFFPGHKINEVIEFIEFQDLAGGYESALPQLPVPPVPANPEPVMDKVETADILPANNELPEDFTAEVPVAEEPISDSIGVMDVTEAAGQGGYGTGMSGISDYKLPTFLGQDYNYFHIWFQEQFKYPVEMKDRNIKRVIVIFMVDREGNVTQIGVRDCPNELLAHEINRVMQSSPRWSPAQRGGKNTNHYFQLPVNIN